MNRTFDTKLMQLMAFFERTTGAKLHDCILEDDLAVFVVEENEMGKAIGKEGRIAMAMRTLLRAAGQRRGRDTALEIR